MKKSPSTHAAPQEPDYPWASAVPQAGDSIEVGPGVRWLRMPLPFALDHINLWLLRDELDVTDGSMPGWSVVDCGMADECTRSAWEQVFATQLLGLPVLRVIATHMHPDHVGLAHWLTQRWSRPAPPGGEAFDCRLWMSATEYAAARLGSRSDNWTGGEAAAAFMAAHGLTDAASIELIRTRAGYYASMVPQVPAAYRRLMDGSVLSIGGVQAAGRHDWCCIAGYGHSPEHLALHCASLGLLISGDMLLPRISTNISVGHDEPEGNPLAAFLASLERMRTLPDDTLVLPSHGKPFRGLQSRIDQLQAHHAARLSDVMSACAGSPRSAADLLTVLFRRPLDVHQTTFAMGESIAHLNALWHDGKLVRRLRDGIYRFSPA